MFRHRYALGLAAILTVLGPHFELPTQGAEGRGGGGPQKVLRRRVRRWVLFVWWITEDEKDVTIEMERGNSMSCCDILCWIKNEILS